MQAYLCIGYHAKEFDYTINKIIHMRKNLLFIFSAICLLAGCAQQPKLPTFRNTGNPLVKDKFTADPAPLVHNDTLYLYVGHDEY